MERGIDSLRLHVKRAWAIWRHELGAKLLRRWLLLARADKLCMHQQWWKLRRHCSARGVRRWLKHNDVMRLRIRESAPGPRKSTRAPSTPCMCPLRMPIC
ncbi:MAG: hypothetical protein SGPRY_010912, partial [Prymnesium sp.]